MTGARAALGAAVVVLSGCGATTVRAAVGPTIDSGGRPGVVGTLSLGVGWPLDYHGRSHHYVQALAGVGGGRDGATGAGMVTAALDVDHIYWGGSHLDTRAGLHFAYQGFPDKGGARVGGGAHAGIVPIVYQNDASWLVTQLCIGPEVRVEALSGNPGNPGERALGFFSLPLLVELNFLGAGD